MNYTVRILLLILILVTRVNDSEAQQTEIFWETPLPSTYVDEMRFSIDGNEIFVVIKKRVYRINAKSGVITDTISPISAPDCKIATVSMSPDGAHYAVGVTWGEHHLGYLIVHAATGEVEQKRSVATFPFDRPFDYYGQFGVLVRYSSDGNFLAVGLGHHHSRQHSASQGGSIKFFDVQTGEQITELNGGVGFTYDIFFSNDGAVMGAWGESKWSSSMPGDPDSYESGSSERFAIKGIPDGNSHTVLRKALTSRPRAIVSAPSIETLFVADDDGLIHAATSNGESKLLYSADHGKSIIYLALSDDESRLASLAEDGTILYWNTATGKNNGFSTLPLMSPKFAVASPDGSRLAVITADSTLSLMDLEQALKAPTFRFVDRIMDLETATVRDFAISSDMNRIALIEANENTPPEGVNIYRFESGAREFQMRATHEKPEFVEFAPFGRKLAEGAGATIRVWDVDAYLNVFDATMSGTTITAVRFARNGLYIAAASDGSDTAFVLWNSATGAVETVFNTQSTIRDIRFAFDGRSIFTVSEGAITEWNIATGVILNVIATPEYSPARLWLIDHAQLAVTAEADGEFLRNIAVWNLETGQQERAFDPDEGSIINLAITQASRQMYIMRSDNSQDNIATEIRVLRLDDGSIVRTINDYPIMRRSLTISGDERFAVTRGYEKGLVVFRIK